MHCILCHNSCFLTCWIEEDSVVILSISDSYLFPTPLTVSLFINTPLPNPQSTNLLPTPLKCKKLVEENIRWNTCQIKARKTFLTHRYSRMIEKCKKTCALLLAPSVCSKRIFRLPLSGIEIWGIGLAIYFTKLNFELKCNAFFSSWDPSES